MLTVLEVDKVKRKFKINNFGNRMIYRAAAGKLPMTVSFNGLVYASTGRSFL